MDISFASYIIFVVIILQCLLFWNVKLFKATMLIVTAVSLIAFSSIEVVDFELYRNWMSHVDVSVLQFVGKPSDALASTSTPLILVLLLLISGIAGIFFTLYKKVIDKFCMPKKNMRWFIAPLLLVIGALFIIPARGGVGVASLNVGSVYFSQNITANHVAVNPLWNVMYSMEKISVLENRYVYMKHEDAKKIFSHYVNNTNDSTISILRNKHPNIIIIMLESFESDITKTLGRYENVTPRFDSLVHEGVLFSNMYASSIRTDKGLISVLCGYPAQAVNPIIKFSNKLEKLPYISKMFFQKGYNTSFFYGGDKNFTNMNSLLVTGGFKNIYDIESFDQSLRTWKWGVHDEYVYSLAYSHLNTIKQPFFTYILTMSNHEPFEPPMKHKFKGNDDDTKFLNSSYYSDSCLGDFIAKAKKQAWWDNTLIVLIADHATIHPGNKTSFDIIRYQIPMLWLGGALRVKDTVVTKYCGQVDVPKTIMRQLGLPDSAFSFSNDILGKRAYGFAEFCYADGFGIVSKDFTQIYDFTSKRYFVHSGTFPHNDSLLGKAYWQVMNEDFVKK